MDLRAVAGMATRALIALLSGTAAADLVVFLESISTFNNPWRPEDLGRCF